MNGQLFQGDAPQPGFRDAEQVTGPTPTGVDPFADDDATEPTSDEQAQYDQIVTSAYKFLSSEKNMQVITEALNNKRLKVSQNVGRFAARLARMIKQQVEAAQVEVSPEAIREAFAQEIIPKLFEIGEAAQIWEMDPKQEQSELEDALIEGMRNYGEMAKKEGKLPTEEARAFLASQGADISGMAEQAQPNPMAAGVQQANQQMAPAGGPPAQGGGLF